MERKVEPMTKYHVYLTHQTLTYPYCMQSDTSLPTLKKIKYSLGQIESHSQLTTVLYFAIARISQLTNLQLLVIQFYSIIK